MNLQVHQQASIFFAGALGYNWHWGSDYKDTTEEQGTAPTITNHDNAFNYGKGWECDLSIGMFLNSSMAIMLDVGMSWNSLSFDDKYNGGVSREQSLTGHIFKVSPKLRMYSPELFEKFKMFVSGGFLWGLPGDAELKSGHWHNNAWHNDTDTYNLDNALGFRGEIGGLYSFSPSIGAFLLVGADLISYNVSSCDHHTTDPDPTGAWIGYRDHVVTYKDSTSAGHDDSIDHKLVWDASTFTLKVGIQVLF